jgi:hypothetical protein
MSAVRIRERIDAHRCANGVLQMRAPPRHMDVDMDIDTDIHVHRHMRMDRGTCRSFNMRILLPCVCVCVCVWICLRICMRICVCIICMNMCVHQHKRIYCRAPPGTAGHPHTQSRRLSH